MFVGTWEGGKTKDSLVFEGCQLICLFISSCLRKLLLYNIEYRWSWTRESCSAFETFVCVVRHYDLAVCSVHTWCYITNFSCQIVNLDDFIFMQ